LPATHPVAPAAAPPSSRTPASASPAAGGFNQAAGPTAPAAGQIASAAPRAIGRVKRTTTGAAGQIASAAPRVVGQVKRTTGSVTIFRQVTSAGGLLGSSLPTAPPSPSSLSSVVRLAPADLVSLPVIRPPALLVVAPPVALPGGRAGGGTGIAPVGSSTLYPPIDGLIAAGVPPVSAWLAFTATLGAPTWGLPPPHASPTSSAGPTAVAATSVLAGSSSGTAAAPSASARALVNSPADAPASGFASAAGSSSGVAFLLFLLLAGLLALGAPWVRRLLRPSGGSWRPAPFVLIPERPG
jgi:hypothetical protein